MAGSATRRIRQSGSGSWQRARDAIACLAPNEQLALGAHVLLTHSVVRDARLRRLLRELSGVATDQSGPVNGVALQLTRRRLQTLEHLMRGLSEAAIARRMKLSRHTVHEHVKAIYKQLRVHNRAEMLAAVLNLRGQRTSHVIRNGRGDR